MIEPWKIDVLVWIAAYWFAFNVGDRLLSNSLSLADVIKNAKVRKQIKLLLPLFCSLFTGAVLVAVALAFKGII